MKKMIFLMLTLLIWSAVSVNAQVAIGSDQDPHSGAVLDLQSTTQGLKLPTVSLTSVTSFQLAGDPAEAIGMVVYNTNANIANGKGQGLYYWNGSSVTYTPGAAAGTGADYWENGYHYINQKWDAYVSKFGFCYANSEALVACPTGWHLATRSDYAQLIITLASYGSDDGNSAKKMKANATQYTGTDGFVWAWHGYAPGDENNSGWNALPAGYARKNGIGCGWGSMTYYIAASTNMDPGTFGQIGLNYQSSAGVSESGHSWESENQYRVRCVLN